MPVEENTVFKNNGSEPTNQAVGEAMQPQTQENPSSGPPQVSPSDFSTGLPIKKILLGLVGLILVILILFGLFKIVTAVFGQKENEQASLTYWGLWEGENVMGGIISDFEKENPNIKVKYERQDIKQYRETLETRIGNGSGPDIFMFHDSWLPMIQDLLLPLPSDVISKEEFEKQYPTVVQNDLSKNGAIYGIPYGMDTLTLFVNTEIFEENGVSVPTNWDDFIKVARAVTVIDPETEKIITSGAAMGTYDNIDHAPDIMSLLLLQNGADLTNLSTTQQNASDALEFYTSFAKGDQKVWDNTLDNSLLAFAKGNLAMYFGYSWDIFTIQALNQELQFTTHEVPKLPDREITVASYWANGVSSRSKHKDAAFKFMNFLAKKETQQKIYTESAKTRPFGPPYARKDLAVTLENNPLIYPFVKQAENAESSFMVSDTFDNGINDKSNNYLADAIRAALGNTSSSTAVETFSQGINQVLSQYGVIQQVEE